MSYHTTLRHATRSSQTLIISDTPSAFKDLTLEVVPAMGRHLVERIPSAREVERRSQGKSALSFHLQRVYPLSIKKSCSLLSLSSLSLSQNSNASSLNSSFSSWDPKNSVSLRKLFGSCEGTEAGFGVDDSRSLHDADPASGILRVEHDELESAKRCNWITEFSGKTYLF